MEDYKKALNYSFLLLKYRPRSRKEIIYRLKRKKYSSYIIEKVIANLEENNYINDEEFVHIFVSSSLEKGWGRKRIDFVLRRLGIPQELREEALGGKDIYRDKLHQMIELKLSQYKSKFNAYNKILRYFLEKGFDYDDISREMQDLGVDRFENK